MYSYEVTDVLDTGCKVYRIMHDENVVCRLIISKAGLELPASYGQYSLTVTIKIVVELLVNLGNKDSEYDDEIIRDVAKDFSYDYPQYLKFLED